MFLRKAHRPQKFRDTVAVEHSGQVTTGGKVTIQLVRPPDRPTKAEQQEEEEND